MRWCCFSPPKTIDAGSMERHMLRLTGNDNKFFVRVHTTGDVSEINKPMRTILNDVLWTEFPGSGVTATALRVREHYCMLQALVILDKPTTATALHESIAKTFADRLIAQEDLCATQSVMVCPLPDMNTWEFYSYHLNLINGPRTDRPAVGVVARIDYGPNNYVQEIVMKPNRSVAKRVSENPKLQMIMQPNVIIKEVSLDDDYTRESSSMDVPRVAALTQRLSRREA